MLAVVEIQYIRQEANLKGRSYARANQTQVSLTAVKLGLTGFILPFFFIFEPALLVDMNAPMESLMPTLTATIGVIAFAAGLQGWLVTTASPIERIILVITGMFLIEPGALLDIVGIAVFLLCIVWQIVKKKKRSQTDEIVDSINILK